MEEFELGRINLSISLSHESQWSWQPLRGVRPPHMESLLELELTDTSILVRRRLTETPNLHWCHQQSNLQYPHVIESSESQIL